MRYFVDVIEHLQIPPRITVGIVDQQNVSHSFDAFMGDRHPTNTVQ